MTFKYKTLSLWAIFGIGCLCDHLDPLNNFCSQIKNGILYVDGGTETFSDRGSGDGQYPDYVGPITTGPNNFMFAINMTTSWDWKTNISEVVINKTTDALTGNLVPIVENAALFQSSEIDSRIYLYGGATPAINQTFPHLQEPTTTQYSLWSFDINSQNWSQHDISDEIPVRPSRGAYAEAPDKGLAFYLNGVLTNESSSTTSYLGNETLFLEGMVVMDLNNQTATNATTLPITNGHPRARGGMAYIHALGPKGVLITIGGATSNTAGLNLVAMNSVDIFDISTAYYPAAMSSGAGWHSQRVTGTAPESRVDFCLAVFSAPDNSSHNIHLYAGWDPIETNKVFDDVWVLSLPSFTWTQIYSGTSPRFGHTCHPTKNRQMVTIGGRKSANLSDPCDWEYKSVAIYDLTTLEWGSVFTEWKPTYQLPPQISKVVGGGPDGNATKLLPAGGWSTTDLAQLFTGTTNQTAPANLTALPEHPASKKSHTSVIIGCGIGVPLALILLGFSLCYLIQQKFPRYAFWKRKEPEDCEGYTKPELPSESVALPNTDEQAPVTDSQLSGTTSSGPTEPVISNYEADGNVRCEAAGQQMCEMPAPQYEAKELAAQSIRSIH